MTERLNYTMSCGNMLLQNMSCGTLSVGNGVFSLSIGRTNILTPTSQKNQNMYGTLELCVAAATGQYSTNANEGDAVIRSMYGDNLILQSNGGGSSCIFITTSGNARITGLNTTAWDPAHLMYNRSSSANPGILGLLAPNITPTNYAVCQIGRSLNFLNAATLGFYYAGNGSFSNSFQVNIYGAGSGVSIAAGATSWTAVSDRTLKTNFEDIESPLTKICSIKGAYYKFLTDNETQKRRVGVIAQDVQAVLPEIVYTVQDGKLGVNYTELVPLLIEGIKEQQKNIELRQQKINVLKEFIKSKFPNELIN